MDNFATTHQVASALDLTITPGASVNGNAIDAVGCDEITFVVMPKKGGATSLTVKVQEATASGGSYSDVAGATTGAMTTGDSSPRMIKVPISGTRLQFLRVNCAVAGSADAASVVTVLAILSGKKSLPVSAAQTLVSVS